MHLTRRNQIGLALMVSSVLVGTIIQLLSGRVKVMDARTLHVEKLPSGAVVSEIMLDVHWRFGIPLVAGFGLGLICLVWPSRRPPRISQ
jgi:hypothetical protein